MHRDDVGADDVDEFLANFRRAAGDPNVICSVCEAGIPLADALAWQQEGKVSYLLLCPSCAKEMVEGLSSAFASQAMWHDDPEWRTLFTDAVGQLERRARRS